jgi:hypothetical protein
VANFLKYHYALPYYQSGKKPEILFVSGIHGDEYGVIPYVKKALKKYGKHIPPYMYIPQASKTAVAQKTRRNEDDVDINRHFFSGTSVEEVVRIQTLVSQFRFSYTVTFHEDRDEKRFYMYDMGGVLHETHFFDVLKNELKKLGIFLLDGIDDPNDPILGHRFLEGYCALVHGGQIPENGTLEQWLITHSITKQVLAVEVPGKVSTLYKDKIVDTFFRQIILPLGSIKVKRE